MIGFGEHLAALPDQLRELLDDLRELLKQVQSAVLPRSATQSGLCDQRRALTLNVSECSG